MQKVLFDSSFLIAVMKRPTTWYEDIVEAIGSFEPVMIDSVYRELERLEGEGRGRSRFAALAKSLADEGMMRLEYGRGGKPDDEIASLAGKEGAFVATVDEELARQLRAAHIPVISLSGGRVSLRL